MVHDFGGHIFGGAEKERSATLWEREDSLCHDEFYFECTMNLITAKDWFKISTLGNRICKLPFCLLVTLLTMERFREHTFFKLKTS